MHCRVRIFCTGLLCCLIGLALYSQTGSSPPAAGADSLTRETLTYGIEWRLFRAGVAKLSWQPILQAKPTYDVNLHLESAGTLAKLYKVDDAYHSRLEDNLCASYFTLKTIEGKRSRDTQVNVDRNHRRATYVERDLIANKTVATHQIDVPACVPDVIGALQRMRLSSITPGQSMQIPVTDGKKWTNAKVEAQEREDVKTPSGAYKTVRYEAYLFDGALFARKARLFVWLTDDGRKLPVQIRVKFAFPVGTVTLQLEKEEKT